MAFEAQKERAKQTKVPLHFVAEENGRQRFLPAAALSLGCL
jgi:hypothetical protein